MRLLPRVEFYAPTQSRTCDSDRRQIVVRITAAPRDTRRHIVYVVDTSSCMAKPGRPERPSIETAKDFLECAIRAAAVADDTQVAIVAFSTTATPILSLGSVAAPQNMEAAFAAIRGLRAADAEAGNGGTHVSAGLGLAYAILAGVGAADSRHIVLITGSHSCGTSPDFLRSRAANVYVHLVNASESFLDSKTVLVTRPDSVTSCDRGSELLEKLSLGYDVGDVNVIVARAKDVGRLVRVICIGTVTGDTVFSVAVPHGGTVKVDILRSRGHGAPYVTESAAEANVCVPPPPSLTQPAER